MAEATTHRLCLTRYCRVALVPARLCCNGKPWQLGVGVDTGWDGMVEVRFLLVWWHLVVFIGDDP